MAQLEHKIKAFSILEVMVALVIIMVVFGYSSVMVTNAGGIDKIKLDAYTLVNKVRNQSIKESRFIDEAFEFENLLIEKTILDYPPNNNLKVLLVEAYEGDEKIIENRELILPTQINP